MAKKTLGEIFGELPKKIKNADKVEWLRQFPDRTTFYVLQIAFDPGIKWLLPEGTPPFTPFKGRKGAAPSDLMRELRHLYLYLEGGEPGLKQLKRELMFGKMLMDLEQIEVDLIVAIKDKTFEKTFRCPRKVVEEAFPGLLTHPFDIRFIRR